METYTWWHIEANTRTKAHHTHKAQATYITTTHRQWTMQKKKMLFGIGVWEKMGVEERNESENSAKPNQNMLNMRLHTYFFWVRFVLVVFGRSMLNMQAQDGDKHHRWCHLLSPRFVVVHRHPMGPVRHFYPNNNFTNAEIFISGSFLKSVRIACNDGLFDTIARSFYVCMMLFKLKVLIFGVLGRHAT